MIKFSFSLPFKGMGAIYPITKTMTTQEEEGLRKGHILRNEGNNGDPLQSWSKGHSATLASSVHL